MRKRKPTIRTGAGGFFLSVAAFALVSIWQTETIRKELPRLVEWYSGEGFSYTKEQLSGLAQSPDTGFYIQAQLPVQEQVLGSVQEMTVRMADAEYFAFTGMELECGDWPQGEEAAVSFDWALAHYKYLDITGQEIQIAGRTCRISGIYRTKRSWRQELAADGRDVIYMPFAVHTTPAFYEIHYLYFPKRGGDFQCNQNYLEDIAAKASGVRQRPDLTLDVESAAHVFFQNIVIGGLFLLAAAIAFCRRNSWRAAGAVCESAGMAVIVCWKWYIPIDALPRTHIFDLSGYFAYYVQTRHLRDFHQECGYFGNLVQMHTGISWGALAVTGSMAALYVTLQTMQRVCLQRGRKGEEEV